MSDTKHLYLKMSESEQIMCVYTRGIVTPKIVPEFDRCEHSTTGSRQLNDYVIFYIAGIIFDCVYMNINE